MVSERVAALRRRMKEAGVDAYYIPTDDFHGSEYVGSYFKCPGVYFRVYPVLPVRRWCWPTRPGCGRMPGISSRPRSS